MYVSNDATTIEEQEKDSGETVPSNIYTHRDENFSNNSTGYWSSEEKKKDDSASTRHHKSIFYGSDEQHQFSLEETFNGPDCMIVKLFSSTISSLVEGFSNPEAFYFFFHLQTY